MIAGHCISIDHEWWHRPGECPAPECRTTPCCKVGDDLPPVERENARAEQ